MTVLTSNIPVSLFCHIHPECQDTISLGESQHFSDRRLSFCIGERRESFVAQVLIAGTPKVTNEYTSKTLTCRTDWSKDWSH